MRHALRRYAEERGPIAANRALSILKTALRFASDAGYLEISPVDRAWLRRWCQRERISPAFRPHDLRRTCATRLNTLGVLPHIAEKILNHTMQGVMAVYNRAEYEAERIEAMQRWADELDRVLGQSLPLNEAPEAAQERPSAPGSRASRPTGRPNP